MSDPEAPKKILAAALVVPVDTVPDDARIGGLERWDSLAHMRLLLAIEEALGRELSPEEAAGVESLADVRDVLQVASRPDGSEPTGVPGT
ncbi:MAG: acyl carrier protein [Methyloligellaceae bacterium]